MADHGPSMLRSAWHVLSRYGGSEAEDVVQEAFIAALTTDSLPHGDVGAWLRSIAVRTARRRAEAPLLDQRTEEPATVEVLAVREALARLSPSDRAVLVLVDLDGRSMAEAATVLGATVVGTRLRAVRARRKLAQLLRGRREA